MSLHTTPIAHAHSPIPPTMQAKQLSRSMSRAEGTMREALAMFGEPASSPWEHLFQIFANFILDFKQA